MKTITVFILPVANGEPIRLIDSLKDLTSKIILVPDNKRNYNKGINTDWKLFLYADEFLSEELRESIPLILNLDYDFFSFYKKNKKDEMNIEISPRLFKKYVVLRENCIYPISGEYRWEVLLNGFILGN
jgi:hypothetical protein